VGHHLWKLFSKDSFEDLLVDQNTEHVRIVVEREDVLGDRYKYPERLFFVQVFQEVPNDEVHALAVPNGRVALHEGR